MKMHHLLFFSIILFSQMSIAAYVTKIKGKKVLISLEGMSVNKGEMLESIDPMTKKKTSYLQVTAVKNDRAIALVLKGRAKINQMVRPKGGSSQASHEMPVSHHKNSRNSPQSKSTFAFGGLLGAGFDTMKINIGGESITQTGMGLGLLGAADMWLNSWFSIRAMAGIEQFNVKANSTACGTATCETKITNFTGMAWGRIHILETVWVGATLGLQQPLSKSTNALEESSIGTSAMYGVGGGMDIALGRGMYIPVQAEYGMQPKSPNASSSYYGIRTGLMLRY